MKKLCSVCSALLIMVSAYATSPFNASLRVQDIDFSHVEKAVTVNKAPQAKPVELKEYKASTYDCAYFDWWYFGTVTDYTYFGFVILNEQGKEVAFTVMTPSEADMAAYYDGIQFPDEYEDRDVESHYYISTEWILNSPNGVRFGSEDVVEASVFEISSGSSSMYALKSGTYYLRVMEMFINGSEAQMGTGYDQIKFVLGGDNVQGLKAEVAPDLKTAAISWTKTSLPADAHLYLNVHSGADVVFDNIDSKQSPDNPLTINVKEGRTYTVTARYVTSKNKPLGNESVISFTVGTNNYLPKSPNAVVSDGDVVTFSWSAEAKADAYIVNVYQSGLKYAEYNVTEQSFSKKLTTGTYNWEVAAMERGEDGMYYIISDYVKGNSFSTESAPLPAGTIEMDVWGMEAFYMSDFAAGGKYPFLITIETGTPNGTGLPEPWIIIWSDHEYAISGTYSDKLGNVEISTDPTEGTMINTNGTEAGLLAATSVDFTLEFEGFDMDYKQMGNLIPYYSGEFLMTCTDGNTYHGIINQLICGTYAYDQSFSHSVLINMFEEDPEYQGVENVQGDNEQGIKRLENGIIIIERNGVKYNVLGTKIK
ncbi:MAG: hypothetical protein II551_02885 [Paludibacteraceae bacterium]|nr:hypothetical protein [Paludibacteraceae bacterium]